VFGLGESKIIVADIQNKFCQKTKLYFILYSEISSLIFVTRIPLKRKQSNTVILYNYCTCHLKTAAALVCTVKFHPVSETCAVHNTALHIRGIDCPQAESCAEEKCTRSCSSGGETTYILSLADTESWGEKRASSEYVRRMKYGNSLAASDVLVTSKSLKKMYVYIRCFISEKKLNLK